MTTRHTALEHVGTEAFERVKSELAAREPGKPH